MEWLDVASFTLTCTACYCATVPLVVCWAQTSSRSRPRSLSPSHMVCNMCPPMPRLVSSRERGRCRIGSMWRSFISTLTSNARDICLSVRLCLSAESSLPIALSTCVHRHRPPYCTTVILQLETHVVEVAANATDRGRANVVTGVKRALPRCVRTSLVLALDKAGLLHAISKVTLKLAAHL